MLTVIHSRVHDGKTTEIINRIGELMRQGKRSVLIVPDQVTYAAERDICSQLGISGFSLCQVMSFNRFCEAVLRSAGKKCPRRLTDAGRMMLLERAVILKRDSLRIYGSVCRRSGFAQRMERMLALLKSCRISPDSLLEMCSRLPASLLKEKLSDTAELYRCYQELTGADYCDNNDLFGLAADCGQSPLLKDCRIFIDGFDSLTGQMLWLIQKLLRSCDITVSLSLDDSAPWLYSMQRRTMDGLVQAAANSGSVLRCVELPHINRGNSFDALHGLYGKAESTAAGGGIDFFQAPDTEAEIRHIAFEIRQKLKLGARYRDFAVACCDTSLISSVERIFAQYSLAVFCDTARPMQAQPAVQLLMSALEACRADNSQREMTEFLCNYLCPLPVDVSERLRVLISSLGLTNYELIEQCSRGSEETRAFLAGISGELLPLRVLRKALRGCKSARDFITAVWDFIQAVGLSGRVDKLISRCIENGLLAEADEYKQVWDNLTQQLEQLDMLLKDCPDCDPDMLISMLGRAFESQSCFVLPSTVDCITVGDPARSRFSGIKELYVIGAADPYFPVSDSGEGLLSPQELSRINRNEKVISPDTEDASVRNTFLLFSMLLAPSVLHLSYALKKGRAQQQPGSLLERVLASVPVERREADTQQEMLACPMGALEILASSERLTANQSAAMQALEMLRPGLLASVTSPVSDRVTDARALYGSIPISMSRLETQAECPLKNLLTGGLRMNEDTDYQSNAIDIGNIMHEALEHSVPELMQAGKEARNAEFARGIVEKNLYAAARSTHDGVMLHTARARLLCARLNKSVTAACRSIMEDLDTFKPFAFEVSFGRGKYPAIELDTREGRVRLQGKIDRVDKSADGRALRIVDYKSSKHSITAKSVERGTTLQLPLYMIAMEKATGARGAAMYYQNCFGTGVCYSGLSCEDSPAPDKNALPQAEFRAVLDSAKDTAARLAADMLQGRTDTDGVITQGASSPCAYCAHSAVCSVRLSDTSQTEYED